MIDYDKVYDDFLFDCHVANQRLSEEDWLYFGREMHHVEIPDRDGGLLTPLNSQPLTTYQHWVAGVLQSELLGKCCFAMIPANKLFSCYEKLRKKWISQFEGLSKEERKLYSERLSESVKRSWKKLTPEEVEVRSNLISQGCQDWWVTASEEQKLERISKMSQSAAIAKAAILKQKPVEVIFPDGKIGRYPSLNFVCLALNVTGNPIRDSIRLKRPLKRKCKGCLFQYCPEA